MPKTSKSKSGSKIKIRKSGLIGGYTGNKVQKDGNKKTSAYMK
jgi:hypothetical protein